MNHSLETFTYTLPAHWASALLNEDYSGLDEEEEQSLKQWARSEKPGYCVGCSDSQEFQPFNDAGTLACDVLEFHFHRGQE